MIADGWPVARLDDNARLRLLAEGLPGVAVHERHIPRPFAEVWACVTDFEGTVPAWEADVSSARIRGRDGERIDLVARGPWWSGKAPVPFTVDLRDGWCWMVARPRVYVVGMAAVPDGAGTRFTHLEGMVLPAGRWLRPFVRPVLALSRWRHRHHVPRDVDAIVRLLTGE